MILRKIFILLFLLFSFFISNNALAQAPNTGFVSGNIWYSKDPFEEGDIIKIYTLVFNPDRRELSGTVFFFDHSILLGKKDFVAMPNSTATVFTNWTVTAGDHTIYGKIENARFLITEGKYDTTYLSQNETQKSARFVGKKITTQRSSDDDKSDKSLDIGKTLEENIPDFISKPATSTISFFEKWRVGAHDSMLKNGEESKRELKKIDEKAKQGEEQSFFVRPFKYIEIFIFSILGFLLKNKVLYYGLILIISFFIIRYIWKRFF